MNLVNFKLSYRKVRVKTNSVEPFWSTIIFIHSSESESECIEQYKQRRYNDELIN